MPLDSDYWKMIDEVDQKRARSKSFRDWMKWSWELWVKANKAEVNGRALQESFFSLYNFSNPPEGMQKTEFFPPLPDGTIL